MESLALAVSTTTARRAATRSIWIPEDDLLMKNAVEAGASLESLAKGAIRFSRRFTLPELQSRWHSLLYDADTSAMASSRMVDLELSAPLLSPKSKKLENLKENQHVPQKRKAESVRSHYYAMRKRIFNEPSNFPDLSLLPDFHDITDNESGCQEYLAYHDEDLVGNCILDDPIPNYFEHSNPLEDNVPDDIMGSNCLFGSTENAPPMPGHGMGHLFDNGNADKYISHIEEMGLPQAAQTGDLFENDDLEAKLISPFYMTNNIPVNYLAGSPGSDYMSSFNPLGCSSPLPPLPFWEMLEDTPTPAMPVDATLESEEKVCDGGLNNSIAITGDLLEMSNSLFTFTNEEMLLLMDLDAKNTTDSSYLDGFGSVLLSSPAHNNQEGLNEIGEPSVCSSEINGISYTKIPNPGSPEKIRGVIYCTLNTEDPDVPCNDDVVLPILVTSQFHNQKTSRPAPFSTKIVSGNQKTTENVINVVNEDRDPFAKYITDDYSDDLSHSENDSGQCRTSGEIRDEIVKVESESVRNCDNCKDSSKERPIHVSTHEEPSSREMIFPEPVINPLTPSLGELSENDGNDIPDYSDVEAAILEMDLDLGNEESYYSREVSRYRCEDTKKTIVRLVQGGDSCMQRTIASHRAFAALFGHNSKHYIRKSEVLLGRATEDNIVDIDLGREQCAGSISRRQANINMEEDGSFFLKNLGKLPIFVNNTELPSGHRVGLTSSCLIQIRSLSFIFETNKKMVRQHLAKTAPTKDIRDKSTDICKL